MMGGCYDGDLMTEDVILDDGGSGLVSSDQSVYSLMKKVQILRII